MRACLLAVVVCLATAFVPVAAAAIGAEQQLAEKFAPVVGLKQHEPCASTGEPYRPVPVETVLGQPGVVLLGLDGTVVKKAPTTTTLYGKGEGYWLDFPGDPLDAGCSYEHVVIEARNARATKPVPRERIGRPRGSGGPGTSL